MLLITGVVVTWIVLAQIIAEQAERRTVPVGAVAPGVPAPDPPAREIDLEQWTSSGTNTLVSNAWVEATAAEFGVPSRVLRSYVGAALVADAENPACGIDWTTLAGIGSVESVHGTVFGGTITDEGWQEPRVIGIALDGTTTDAIADTDAGALDGDTEWDRAVGPMQFIPSTWELYGADGNVDGVTDPQHIDDATLAAARYLCSTGQDLRTDEGWILAISAYNSSLDYNQRVAAATTAYRGG